MCIRDSANGNRTLGTSAIGGMLIGMILQIFIVPVNLLSALSKDSFSFTRTSDTLFPPFATTAEVIPISSKAITAIFHLLWADEMKIKYHKHGCNILII